MSEVFGRIILERKSQFLNRLKGYKVMINGLEQGVIRNGKTEEYEMPAGPNEITCRVNWCRSNSFMVDVKAGEAVYLKVGSGMKYFWPVYILVLIVLLLRFARFTFTAYQQEVHIASLVILGLACLYYLYYLTIGRNNYLCIGPDTKNVFAG